VIGVVREACTSTGAGAGFARFAVSDSVWQNDVVLGGIQWLTRSVHVRQERTRQQVARTSTRAVQKEHRISNADRAVSISTASSRYAERGVMQHKIVYRSPVVKDKGRDDVITFLLCEALHRTVPLYVVT